MINSLNADCEKVNKQNGAMDHLTMPDPGRKKPVKELDFQEHKKGMGKKADNHHRMSFKESETNI